MAFDDSWLPLEKLYLIGIRTCVSAAAPPPSRHVDAMCAHGGHQEQAFSYFEVT